MSTICVNQIGCKKMAISVINSVPATAIVTHTKITVEYDGVVYTLYDEDDEMTVIEVLPVDVNQTDVLKDGYYYVKFVIDYTLDGESEIATIEDEFYNKCNLECRVDKLVADYADDDCDGCKKDKEEMLLDVILKMELLCYNILCSDRDTVNTLHDYLDNKLINYNCNNC